MNEVRTTGSWLIIWLSVLALGALLWFSVIKQFDNGVQGAVSALLNRTSIDANAKEDDRLIVVAESGAVERIPVFTLEQSALTTEVRAELPKGDISNSVWEALGSRAQSGLLKVRVEEYQAVDDAGPVPQWVTNLPKFIENLPSQSDESEIQLTISDEKTTVRGQVGSIHEREQLTRALGKIAPNTEISSEALKITGQENPVLSIEKNGSILELKGQLASQYLDNKFAEELKTLTNSTELIDSLRYSSDISSSAIELENIGAVSELLATNGSRAIIKVADRQYNMSLFGYSGESTDELRAQVANLLGDVPFQFAIGRVGSNQVAVLPEAPDEQQDTNFRRSILAVNFGFNSYTLTPESEPALSGILARMWANPELRLVIEGHTDSTGSPVSNQLLSQQRAEAVKNYLVESGINANRLKALGFGDEKPISSNETSEGRFNNRRIEVREEQIS